MIKRAVQVLESSHADAGVVKQIPIRLRLSRQAGFRLVSPNGLPVVCVTRPGKWGNPFVVGEVSDASKLGYGTPEALCGVLVRDNAHAVQLFEWWLTSLSDVALGWRISLHVLRDCNLACWCRFDAPCHADVLLRRANRLP